MSPIRVLVVDDSALMRKYLHDTLSSDPDIEVIGSAPNPNAARDMIKRLNPDVLTLDIEMPGMNGLEFLGHVMRLRPMPVIMFSSLTQDGSKAALQALEIGAFDFVHKPCADYEETWVSVGATLISRIKVAAAASAGSLAPRSRQTVISPQGAPSPWPRNRVVAIGSSAGGVQALREVLAKLPDESPPILIAQHMPAKFTRAFAGRLNGGCRVEVHEAMDGQKIKSGNVYIAPGDHNLSIEKSGIALHCRLQRDVRNGPTHVPSIDRLFQSMAEVVGPAAMGIVLTGMGKDGAHGLRLIREAGGTTAAQDEETSLIYGMPKAAVELGAAQFEISLKRVPSFILERHARSKKIQKSISEGVWG